MTAQCPLWRWRCLGFTLTLLAFVCVADQSAPGQGTPKKKDKDNHYLHYLNQLKHKFQVWDSNDDGALDKAELAKAFRGAQAKPYDFAAPAKDKKIVVTTTTKAKVKPYSLALACLPRPGLAVNLAVAELLTKPETVKTVVTKPGEQPRANPAVMQYGDFQLLALIGGKDDKISKAEFDNWAKTYAKNLDRQDDLEREVKSSQEKVAKTKGKAKQEAEAALKRHLNDLNNVNAQLKAISPQIKNALGLKK